MLDLGGFEAHALSAEELEDLSVELDELRETTEDLFDQTLILPQAMYILARRAGVRALLDGVDGDVVTSQSPDCVAAHLRSGRWRTALSAARRDSAFYRGIYPPWGSTSRLLYHGLRTAYVPNALRRMRKGMRQRAEVRRNIRESIIAPDFARRIDLAGRLDLLRSYGRRTPWGTLREEHARNVLSPYITVAVERYDRVSAAYGVEARHPFLDKRVIELCLSLPWDQKFGRGWPKRILRHAMSGILPDAVRWRRGGWEHLGWAFWAALLNLRRHLMDEVVQGGLATVSQYVNVPAVRTAYRRYRATGDMDEGVKVWEATALSSWLGRTGRAEATSLAAG